MIDKSFRNDDSARVSGEDRYFEKVAEIIRRTSDGFRILTFIRTGVLIPCVPEVCKECGVNHDLEQPHSKQSPYYQYKFLRDHGRWPTWEDAMSHCTSSVQSWWKKELRNRDLGGHRSMNNSNLVLKQSLPLQCICGQAVRLPEAQVKVKCSCGAVWECGPEGYWYTETHIKQFTPIFTEQVPIAKSSRYERHMERRSKSKKRKAGRGC